MMNKQDIQVSVVMPAYNAGPFIAEAIASVLAQSFTHFELIIVNDGSTDDTVAIIQSFNDPHIVLVQQENKGVAAALNTGLQYARANYIARFDADDICYPYRLQKQFEFITHHPEYTVIGSAVDYVEQQGEYIFTYYPDAKSNNEIQVIKYRTCPFIHSSVLYNKNAITKYGGYNTYAHSFEDHLLWINVLHEGKGYNIQEPLIKVRLNPQSVTIDEKWRTKEFRKIKRHALNNNTITEVEANQLHYILTRQNNQQVKEGAYYALLTKKYLWNNPHPDKARKNIRKALSLNKWDWNSYLFFFLSFIPSTILQDLYKSIKKGHYQMHKSFSKGWVIRKDKVYA